MAIQETKDLLNFGGDLSAAVAGNPALVAAFRAKDPKAIGAAFASLVTGPNAGALMASGSKAFDGIGDVVTEVKAIGVLDGLDLVRCVADNVAKTYVAYSAAHPKA